MAATTGELREIDKMKRAMRKSLLHKEITLADGEKIDIYYRPLTLAEEERIRKDVGSDATPNAFALRMLIDKAVRADGSRMFNIGDMADLRNAVEKQDAEAAMLVILGNEGEPIDMKSSKAAA
jgi:hypothetical protein